MINRLREKYTDEELKLLYANPHDHTQWFDHIKRVDFTIEIGKRFGPYKSIADLSCGDAAIPRGISADKIILGDYAPGYEYFGPIEITVLEIEPVDLFICSETIEHIDQPDRLLLNIREKANKLLLSTPLDEKIYNPQHYWQWDKQGMWSLLTIAGWTPKGYEELLFPELNNYGYQIWYCE